MRDVLPALALDEASVERLDLAADGALSAALPVNTLACGSVALAALAAAALRGNGASVRVEPRQVSVAFRNDQLQTVDGEREPAFAPLSGFFAARDGWVRTHANYPHHRDRLARALDLPHDAGRDAVAAAIAARTAQELEDVVTADHGICVRVRTHREWLAGEQAQAVDQHPVLAVDRLPSQAPNVPVPARPRILDLTRVIAGPVATRTLAFVGCDVLRIDPPGLPELRAQHLDTNAGKRSTLVDLHDEHARRRVHELLDRADVVVTGYRPGALAVYGLDAEHLARTHPHVIHASLAAWTPSGPWGGRRGFDSIVQAATGIAMIESADGVRPGALPAQALDHATGYLLAAGVLSALRRRAEQGGTWRVSAHLARTAHWLLRTDARDGPAHPVADPDPWLVETRTELGLIRQSRPAFQLDGGRREFAWVGRRYGRDAAEWVD
ncbi:CoA transferase [Microlunatus parietis]|uniref:Crotonobetainyl-CoA:carnitine CoA-transferase CaiB-like acyl-CoA transferase n=1 Tax=Microlunatus parietis TaxID=682979 RepID=A0A7Y9I8P4_9ACTN|nr:crotonobetainyl-CoA:carnitine CoA-transferase CaiB-like acyl-CoA transferase [Microlunatus parietis]